MIKVSTRNPLVFASLISCFFTSSVLIREAWIYSSRANYAVRVDSDTTDAVRLEVVEDDSDGKVRLYINNEWNYTDLGLGNYMKQPVIVSEGYRNRVKMWLTLAPTL